MPGPQTFFNDLKVVDAESAVAGRGDLAAQLARVTADLTALTALVNDLRTQHNAAEAELRTLANDIRAKFNNHTHVHQITANGWTGYPEQHAPDITVGVNNVTAAAASAHQATAAAVTVTSK